MAIQVPLRSGQSHTNEASCQDGVKEPVPRAFRGWLTNNWCAKPAVSVMIIRIFRMPAEKHVA